MELSIFEEATRAIFKLKKVSQKSTQLPSNHLAERLYTFAWNTGKVQAIMIDEVTYKFPANSVLPLMMNQRYQFERPEDVTTWQFNREFYCIVNHDAEVGCVGFLFYGLSQTMFIKLNKQTEIDVRYTIQLFQRELSSNEANKVEMLRTLLIRLIILLTREARKQYITNDLVEDKFNLIRNYNLLVEQHYKSQHQVKFYAELLNKSPKTISNVFSLYSEKNPLQIIQERILNEAKRLIYYTDKSLKEISQYLGFDDPAHFSKFFKNLAGTSPTDFKQQWLEGKDVQVKRKNINS